MNQKMQIPWFPPSTVAFAEHLIDESQEVRGIQSKIRGIFVCWQHSVQSDGFFLLDLDFGVNRVVI